MENKKIKAWAILMDSDNDLGLVFSAKHPEEKIKEKGAFVYAIYPNKNKAIHDKSFRGGCGIRQVEITIK